jgi:phage antirepressor protein
MNNQVTIFNNPQFGEIRTAGTADNPLFCLADLCRVLELQAGATKKRLNDRGVSSINTPTYNQYGTQVMQEMIFINEQNLYKVIMRSDKPQAEPFQDWVCGEVLPSIRKTGGYITATPEMSDAEILAKAVLVAQTTIANREILYNVA